MKHEKILDAGFSVFNGHINGADRRAREVMRLTFPNHLAKLEEMEEAEGGIMCIFDHPPNPATSTYVALVTYFVNEDKFEPTGFSKIQVEVPTYPHDCEECLYLGRYENGGRVYDLYYHGGHHKTVIGRYGSDGGDYTSGMAFGREGHVPELREAYNRAKEQGLDVGD